MFKYMNNMASYEDAIKDFSWDLVEKELGYRDGNVINIAEYCTDRNCRMGKGGKKALIWQSEDGKVKTYTFNELRMLSNSVSLYLKSLGINPGDRISMFLDKVPELFIGFLGILKLGAVAVPLDSSFGSESLFTRLNDAKTRVIITQKKHLPKVRSILKDMDFLEHIIVVDEHHAENLKEREFMCNIETCEPINECHVYPSKAYTPSVMLYTAGTSGKPKGVQHVHYSIISQYISAKFVLDLKEDDVVWCTVSPDGVTGSSSGIIGPWANGNTICVLNAPFTPDNWYSFIEKHKVSVWYTVPTFIRSLMKEGEEKENKYNLSSLRVLASIGEPLNPEEVEWSEKVFGTAFHDTFLQTETGSVMIGNYPCMKIKPGSMGKPFPGMEIVILDPKTNTPVKNRCVVGKIGIRPGWPSMFRGYLNQEEAYKRKFDNGWYICNDRASIDEDGYFWFVGRDDDVINTSGYLLGPGEIEAAIQRHPAVAESAAIGKPDEMNMEVVKAFIVLKKGFTPSKKIELEIMEFIRKKISALAMPKEIEFIGKLPKTRSGKIIRRVLRALEWQEEIDPESDSETGK